MGESQSIGLILLGASDFPRSKQFSSSTAFTKSYLLMKDYFIESSLVNDESNILDLFDAEHSPVDLDDQISIFLNKKVKEDEITDLIVYYVGHGGFDNDQGYLLALKKTKDDAKALSGLLLKNLSNRISKDAGKIRTYLIFDCCFSGEASGIFQADTNEILGRQFKSVFPPMGVSMLCSSSKDMPSIIVKERNITMFTEGLGEALRKGSNLIDKKRLSLRQVCDLAYSHIKNLNTSESIKPEVHSPVQDKGDIADLPLFPNLASEEEPYDIEEKIQFLLDCIIDDLAKCVNPLLDLGYNFTFGGALKNEAILIASAINEFLREKDSLSRADQRGERNELNGKMLEFIEKVKKQEIE